MATDGNGIHIPDDLLDLEYRAEFCARRGDRYESQQDGSACLGLFLAIAFVIGGAIGCLAILWLK